MTNIIDWRKTREACQDLDYFGKHTKIENFLKRIPNCIRGIDVYDSSLWLSPWEILSHSEICDDTKTIIYHHSMMLLNQQSRLYLVKNQIESYLGLVCVLEDQIVFGMGGTKFMPFDKNDDILSEFFWDNAEKNIHKIKYTAIQYHLNL